MAWATLTGPITFCSLSAFPLHVYPPSGWDDYFILALRPTPGLCQAIRKHLWPKEGLQFQLSYPNLVGAADCLTVRWELNNFLYSIKCLWSKSSLCGHLKYQYKNLIWLLPCFKKKLTKWLFPLLSLFIWCHLLQFFSMRSPADMSTMLLKGKFQKWVMVEDVAGLLPRQEGSDLSQKVKHGATHDGRGRPWSPRGSHCQVRIFLLVLTMEISSW